MNKNQKGKLLLIGMGVGVGILGLGLIALGVFLIISGIFKKFIGRRKFNNNKIIAINYNE